MLLEGISGNKVDVSDAHQILAKSSDPALEANKRGDGYVLILDGITSDAADQLFALIINKDGRGRDMVVTHFNLRATAGLSGATSFYEVMLGGTFTATVANGVEATAKNLRSGQPNATNICGAQCYVNDGGGDMTTAVNEHIAYRGPMITKGAFRRGWVEGGWVVPYGQTWSLSCGGADTFQGTVQFYFCED